MNNGNIKTEGIRYTGSKKTVIPKIINLISNLQIRTTLDAFSGTTRVGQAFKQLGYDVDSNDLAEYSKVFGLCYLVNNKPKKDFQEKVKHLNSLVGIEGYFTQNYGGEDNAGSSIQQDGKKRIWQRKNTTKLDAIREEIDKISENDIEKAVLLTSLILALDKVDNSLGHQVSYLVKWSSRSYEDIELKVPELLSGNADYNILQQDAKTISKSYDLIYVDPPYGTNNQITKTTRVRYASYYHLWTTVCKNDKPKVFGAANRREDVSSDTIEGAVSAYEHTHYDVVKGEIKELVDKLNAKYIVFSYSSKSKVSIDDLRKIFNQYNLLKEDAFEHKENVMKICVGNKKWLGDMSANYEYLFLIQKT